MTQAPNSPQEFGKLLARLSRPQNVLYPGLLSALACYLTTGRLIESVACYIFFSTLYGVAVCYNNYIDRETDRRNKRADIPVVTNRLLATVAILYFVMFLAIEPVLAQPVSALFGVIYLGLSFAYSHPKTNIQSKGWWAPVLLSLCYGVLPLFAGLFQGAAMYSLASLAALGLMQIALLYPILLAKDYKDFTGDLRTNKKTPLVRYGPKVVRLVAYVVSFFTIVLSIWLTASALALTTPLLFAYLLYVYHIHAANGQVPWFVQRLSVLCILSITCLALA